ncbi:MULTISPECIES: twin-arginine translocase subunit TatC [Micrococcaceae]|uniref:twin-arginine translocase subunit TatC n=1 Tax=Micrococcaceae TaxID=1268 RepID=UPI00180A70B7|nr:MULTISPECIES: twin-arginine translocase subunit TatC [Micrococcaceae]MBB5748956.1 sec-independent protein translocase protein TatC [Micrococcus sp. TA1]HRO29203.1 twin-arginine translocase subunit TatC [Citricoccus sp.]HRO92869.1 twin-arginine translocase subunit TatC [Citricoccus sp.]
MSTASEAGRSRRVRVSRRKNPDGQMPLKDHLRELRNRLIIAGIGLLLGAIVGFIIYQPFFSALIDPVHRLSDEGRIVTVAFSAVGQPFDIMLQVALFVGVVISSPVWLYQLWAFVVPGLKKKEKRYALGFIAAAVPLFVLGVGLGWLVLPEAVQFFVGLSPEGTANVITADVYIPFVLRLFLAFGVALVLPVVLVGLNMLGVLPGRQILKHWRITVFVIALIAALAAPGSDAMTMFYLAIPLVLLFGVAIVICLINDRRRARRTARLEQANEDYLGTGPTPLRDL